MLLLSYPVTNFYVGGDNTLLYNINPELFLENFVNNNNYNNELVGVGRPFPQSYLKNYFLINKIFLIFGINPAFIYLLLYLLSIPFFLFYFFDGEDNYISVCLICIFLPSLKTGIDHQSMSLLVLPLFIIYMIGFKALVDKNYKLLFGVNIIFALLLPSISLTIQYFIPLIIFIFFVINKKISFIKYSIISSIFYLIMNYGLLIDIFYSIIIPGGYIVENKYISSLGFTKGEAINFIFAFFGSLPIDYFHVPLINLLLKIYIFLSLIIVISKFKIILQNPKIIIIHIIIAGIFSSWFIIDLSHINIILSEHIKYLTAWKNTTDKFTYLLAISYSFLMANLYGMKFKC